ncbi:hypothetical protein TO73_2517 (plasmid) [Thermus aquaticus Y51MC23]|jgi:hypothetical protein|uniref:Uncharacterized protein n=1 Tax=Thermus aquaticus (strain ATCC BAA-2747 / Y51MC23) TaxID=498848 RepID=A0ABM5VPZ7_THEA5|nr:hypothetical protein TO73_2517 [Thermus aquaticus Y51MC23]
MGFGFGFPLPKGSSSSVLARPCRLGPQGGPVYPLGAIIPTPSQRQEGIPVHPVQTGAFGTAGAGRKCGVPHGKRQSPPGNPGGFSWAFCLPALEGSRSGHLLMHPRTDPHSIRLPPSHGNPPGRCLLPVWWALPPIFGLGTAVAVPVWPGHAPVERATGPTLPRSWFRHPSRGASPRGESAKLLVLGFPPQTFQFFPLRALPHPSGTYTRVFRGRETRPLVGAEAPVRWTPHG